MEVAHILACWGLDVEHLTYSNSDSTVVDNKNPLDCVAALEGTNYLRNQLLPDSDVMSMAAGLELRIPLVDSELQQQLAPIPASLRFAAGKGLFQQAMHELPEWFLARPKQGFRFPFQLWLDDPSSPLRLNLPPTPSGLDLRAWYRRWSLMVLAHWLREHMGVELIPKVVQLNSIFSPFSFLARILTP